MSSDYLSDDDHGATTLDLMHVKRQMQNVHIFFYFSCLVFLKVFFLQKRELSLESLSESFNEDLHDVMNFYSLQGSLVP